MTKLWLESHGWNYGRIGKRTGKKDKNGTELFVGDMVRAVNNNTGHTFTNAVVKNNGKFFIMGIQVDSFGLVSSNWTWVKVKDHSEIEEGVVNLSFKAVTKKPVVK